MSYEVNRYLGENAFSKIESNQPLKSAILSIAQKADALNLEQLPEKIFGLTQDIFKSLNEISGRNIQFEKEKLQKQLQGEMRKFDVENPLVKMGVDIFGGSPPTPPPQKVILTSVIFDLYLSLVKQEDYKRRLDNDEDIDMDVEGERYVRAISDLNGVLASWLGVDPRLFD